MLILLIIALLIGCHVLKRTDNSLLESAGITVNSLSVTWTSSSLCTWLGRVGSKLSRLFEVWFGVGALICSVIAAMNLLVLTLNFIRLLFVISAMMVTAVGGRHDDDVNNATAAATSNTTAQSAQSPLLLQLLVPGVTVPSSHATHLFLAAFVTLSFHELGHALAAASTHLHITNFGFSLYAIFPTTFVVIEDHIRRISPHRQLRIYTAGAFHNLLQAVMVFLIFPVVPSLLHPSWMTCEITHSVKCVWVTKAQQTVLDDIIQLPSPVGAVGISRLNEQEVDGVKGWMHIFDDLNTLQSQQFCVSTATIAATHPDQSCCNKGYNGTNLCFKDLTNNSLCVPGKVVADHPWSTSCCTSSIEGFSCLVLPEAIIGDRNSFIFKFEFTTGQKLTFIDTLEAVSQIGVRQYHPTYIPVTSRNLYDDDPTLYWDVFPYSVVPNFPEDLTILLGYIQMISVGLMLVNLVPFPGLDGQFVFCCLLQILSERLCSPPAPAPELVEIVVNSNARKQQQQQQQQLLIGSSDLSSVRLVGQYGDTGLVDHQLQQKTWQRWLLLFGSVLLVGNWGLSLIITFCS